MKIEITDLLIDLEPNCVSLMLVWQAYMKVISLLCLNLML